MSSVQQCVRCRLPELYALWPDPTKVSLSIACPRVRGLLVFWGY